MKLAAFLGSLALLLTVSAAPADTAKTRAELIALESEIGDLMVEASVTFAHYVTASQQLAALYTRLDDKATSLRAAASACANGCNALQGRSLLAATKDMQETQMSFNLEYLKLQSQMQSDERSYKAKSNIMKTKHDTVKNSISNVR